MSQAQLTQKQEAFATNYIQNGNNIKKAAEQAGYSKEFAKSNGANKLTKHQGIQERIKKAFEQREEKLLKDLGVSIEWRMSKLKSIIDAIVPDNCTKDLIDIPNAKTAIAAIAEINRMYGDYAPDKRLSVTVDATKEKITNAKKVYNEY